MSFTQNDIDNLSRKIAQGVRKVTIDGKAVEYGTLDEMIAARDRMQRELDAVSGSGPRVMTRRTTFTRD